MKITFGVKKRQSRETEEIGDKKNFFNGIISSYMEKVPSDSSEASDSEKLQDTPNFGRIKNEKRFFAREVALKSNFEKKNIEAKKEHPRKKINRTQTKPDPDLNIFRIKNENERDGFGTVADNGFLGSPGIGSVGVKKKEGNFLARNMTRLLSFQSLESEKSCDQNLKKLEKTSQKDKKNNHKRKKNKSQKSKKKRKKSSKAYGEETKIFVFNWNMHGKTGPRNMEEFNMWFTKRKIEKFKRNHLLIFTCQESCHTIPKSFLYNSKWKWRRKLDEFLGALGYTNVCDSSLNALSTMIYIQKAQAHRFKLLAVQKKALGFGGIMYNKGALIVRYELRGMRLASINVHLPHGKSNKDKRYENINKVLKSLFEPKKKFLCFGSKKVAPSRIMDFDFVTFSGDFNFMFKMTKEEFIKLLESNNLSLRDFGRLLRFDEYSPEQIDFGAGKRKGVIGVLGSSSQMLIDGKYGIDDSSKEANHEIKRKSTMPPTFRGDNNQNSKNIVSQDKISEIISQSKKVRSVGSRRLSTEERREMNLLEFLNSAKKTEVISNQLGIENSKNIVNMPLKIDSGQIPQRISIIKRESSETLNSNQNPSNGEIRLSIGFRDYRKMPKTRNYDLLNQSVSKLVSQSEFDSSKNSLSEEFNKIGREGKSDMEINQDLIRDQISLSQVQGQSNTEDILKKKRISSAFGSNREQERLITLNETRDNFLTDGDKIGFKRMSEQMNLRIKVIARASETQNIHKSQPDWCFGVKEPEKQSIKNNNTQQENRRILTEKDRLSSENNYRRRTEDGKTASKQSTLKSLVSPKHLESEEIGSNRTLKKLVIREDKAWKASDEDKENVFLQVNSSVKTVGSGINKRISLRNKAIKEKVLGSRESKLKTKSDQTSDQKKFLFTSKETNSKISNKTENERTEQNEKKKKSTISMNKQFFEEYKIQEGDIRFPPTYKFFSGSSIYYLCNQRLPGYPDRIFFISKKKGKVRAKLLSYKSCFDVEISDHKPVYTYFSLRNGRIRGS